jgi:hypothetical protein
MTDADLRSIEDLRVAEENRRFLQELQVRPELIWPFLRPCDVRVLLVADGGLDFSETDFGLSTFVRTLLDTPGRHVRYRVTLAHISNAAPSQLMDGESRIVRRIPSFRFDVADHFGTDTYDEVWLFGIATSAFGRGNDPNGQPYPTDRLGDGELRALTRFMNAGGGVFATGDHGALGRFLGSAVPRTRNMRLWASTAAQNAIDEVSMTGERRNDTNRIGGSPGSQFDDQSDDTPQNIQPRMYRRHSFIFRFTFPHPLLCGPRGVIRVMPDHPHEGECVEPSNDGLTLSFGESFGPEYPGAVDGGPRPLPEVISTSTVLSGTVSSTGFGQKAATQPHSFGGICAYDGHRAGVGRVVTDATWHHFVNVNLVGQLVPTLAASNPKSRHHPGGGGFLATTTGRAHLEDVRAYYRNIAVWLARPERITCMNSRLVWDVVWSGRVLEAVLTTTDLQVGEVQPPVLAAIGQHARDVLGQHASQCQSVKLIFDLVLQPAIPKLIPEIDPWLPLGQREQEEPVVAWFDGAPILDIAFGAALLGLREAFPQPDQRTVAELETDKLTAILAEAGRLGIERALDSMAQGTRSVARLTDLRGEVQRQKGAQPGDEAQPPDD